MCRPAQEQLHLQPVTGPADSLYEKNNEELIATTNAFCPETESRHMRSVGSLMY
jgi:hypothetical protein